MVDPKYFRPNVVDLLIGDVTEAGIKLGWERKYDLPALVRDLMQSDLKLMQKYHSAGKIEGIRL